MPRYPSIAQLGKFSDDPKATPVPTYMAGHVPDVDTPYDGISFIGTIRDRQSTLLWHADTLTQAIQWAAGRVDYEGQLTSLLSRTVLLSPRYTYRQFRVDLSGANFAGAEARWRLVGKNLLASGKDLEISGTFTAQSGTFQGDHLRALQDPTGVQVTPGPERVVEFGDTLWDVQLDGTPDDADPTYASILPELAGRTYTPIWCRLEEAAAAFEQIGITATAEPFELRQISILTDFRNDIVLGSDTFVFQEREYLITGISRTRRLNRMVLSGTEEL